MPVQSRIAPYDQRDDAWTDNQYDKSHEDEWKAHIEAVGADYLDSALHPIELPESLVQDSQSHPNNLQKSQNLADMKQRYRVETHSTILPYVVRDNAWNFDHNDATNFTSYKEDIPKGYEKDIDFTEPHPIVTEDADGASKLVQCTADEEAEFKAAVADAKANDLPAPKATCLTKEAAAKKGRQ